MSLSFGRVFVAAVILAASIAGNAHPSAAQAPPAAGQLQAPPPASAEPSAPPPVVVGFQDGFFIQDAKGDNRLQFGMTAQADVRVSLDDPPSFVDTLTLRKVRPTFSGRIARHFEFKITPDLASGAALVQDAYLDVRFSRAFRIRVGKDKTPIGHELMVSDAFLLFPERSLASSLVPNRDLGVAAQGDLAGNRVFYAGGVFNGVPDGTSSTSDVDPNSSKDLAGRIVVHPFRDSRAPARLASGLGFQIGGSTGTHAGGPLPTFRTAVGQTYFTYAADTRAVGRRTRLAPAVFYYYRQFGGFAEWVRSEHSVVRNTAETEVANQGWTVTGSFLLTGEAASAGITRPRNAFDPGNGKWGALQLAARYAVLTLDRAAFSSGVAGAGASRRATSFAVGANWYPAAYIKYYATFERTAFEGGALARPDENAIVIRAQLAF